MSKKRKYLYHCNAANDTNQNYDKVDKFNKLCQIGGDFEDKKCAPSRYITVGNLIEFLKKFPRTAMIVSLNLDMVKFDPIHQTLTLFETDERDHILPFKPTIRLLVKKKEAPEEHCNVSVRSLSKFLKNFPINTYILPMLSLFITHFGGGLLFQGNIVRKTSLYGDEGIVEFYLPQHITHSTYPAYTNYPVDLVHPVTVLTFGAFGTCDECFPWAKIINKENENVDTNYILSSKQIEKVKGNMAIETVKMFLLEDNHLRNFASFVVKSLKKDEGLVINDKFEGQKDKKDKKSSLESIILCRYEREITYTPKATEIAKATFVAGPRRKEIKTNDSYKTETKWEIARYTDMTLSSSAASMPSMPSALSGLIAWICPITSSKPLYRNSESKALHLAKQQICEDFKKVDVEDLPLTWVIPLDLKDLNKGKLIDISTIKNIDSLSNSNTIASNIMISCVQIRCIALSWQKLGKILKNIVSE